MTAFPNLFSPLTIRGTTFCNRIMSTGHGTSMATDGRVNDRLLAYHEARAAGGAGLIVTEVATVHETAEYTGHLLNARQDNGIAGYARLAERLHRYDCRVFGQVFHPGRARRASFDGSQPIAFAPSATPEENYKVAIHPMTAMMIEDIIESYGKAAGRMAQAGLDGVEIVASHGYLPAQFLNPRINTRDDDWGGSFENRLRFLKGIITALRSAVGSETIVGMRISGDEEDAFGLTGEDILQVCRALDDDTDGLDYFNVTAGSIAGLGASVHVVPPMAVEVGYTAPLAAAIKATVSKPVFVAGRINQPQIAEQVLSSGQADMCGMTRAMITDPEMANKAREGRADDIRACIGCNQACIGHMQSFYPISCIQRPETGRELDFVGDKVATPRRILVAGGGPAGMKAAAVAAERGHDVTLHEGAARLGGQTLLAQLLPGRAEFGGIVTNLARDMELARVKVVTNSHVDRAMIEREAPDAVIVATGALPYRPPIEGQDEGQVVDAWSVIRDEANVGASVVIADWKGDWIGLGVAEKLARAGCHVRLAINGTHAGMNIQKYVRDMWIGTLHKLGVEIIPYARLYGVDADTVYLQHTTSSEPIICNDVDTLVASLGHEAVSELQFGLEGWEGETHLVGDCYAPRTCEEAVLEGLRAGAAV